MPTDLPLPDLDKLHAATTPGEWSWWTSCSMKRLTAEGGCDGGVLHAFVASDGVACVGVSDEDAAWIATIHNAWPQISARLKELENGDALDESFVDALPSGHWIRVWANETDTICGLLHWEPMSSPVSREVERKLARIDLLEETLRGILQEKRDDLAHDIYVGTRPTEKLEQQIAWLESVLGGGK